MSGTATISDRQAVEQYLKLYCIEECLDEVINEVVEKRPTNPYMAMSQVLEAKSMPEILSLTLSPLIIGRGGCGVLCTLITNIAQFTGSAGYAIDISSDADAFKDFSVIQEKIRDAVKGVNVQELWKADDILRKIAGIDTPVSLAVSIAFWRAGARHKSMPLYKYIAECAETSASMRMPMPVMTMAGRAIPGFFGITQQITMTPTSVTSFDGAMEAGMKAAQSVMKKLEGASAPGQSGALAAVGCPRVLTATIEEAAKLVMAAVQEGGVPGGLRLGLDCASPALYKSDSPVDSPLYQFEGAAAAGRGGGDYVEQLVTLWRETELISLEDPLLLSDINALRALKNRVSQVMSDVKRDMSDSLAYAAAGVGCDEACPLQVIADSAVVKGDDIARLQSEMTYNAVKVRLGKTGTVSQAVALCKAARQMQWCVIVGCEEATPETSDTFLADFAVAMGASQFMGGGVYSGEHNCKYNRLMEIGREDEGILFSFTGRRFRKT